MMAITVDANGDLLCEHCEEPILKGELSAVENVPLHGACAFRLTVGGANHIMKRCPCYLKHEPPDPPGLSKRGAADAAVAAWHVMNGGG